MKQWMKWCPCGCGRRMTQTCKKVHLRAVYKCSECGIQLSLKQINEFWNSRGNNNEKNKSFKWISEFLGNQSQKDKILRRITRPC